MCVSVLQLDVNKVTVYTGSQSPPKRRGEKLQLNMPLFTPDTKGPPLHKTTALTPIGVGAAQLEHYDGVTVFAKGCQLRAMQLSTRLDDDTLHVSSDEDEVETFGEDASQSSGNIVLVPEGEWGGGLRLMWCSHILDPTNVAAVILKCRNPNHALLPSLAVRLAFSTIRVHVGGATLSTLNTLATMWKGQVQLDALEKEWGDSANERSSRASATATPTTSTSRGGRRGAVATSQSPDSPSGLHARTLAAASPDNPSVVAGVESDAAVARATRPSVSSHGHGMSRDPTREELRRKPKAAFVVSVDGMALVLMAPPPVATDGGDGGRAGGAGSTPGRSRQSGHSAAASDTSFRQSRVGLAADTRTVGRLAIENLVVVASRRRAFDEMRMELGGFAVEKVSSDVVPHYATTDVIRASVATRVVWVDKAARGRHIATQVLAVNVVHEPLRDDGSQERADRPHISPPVRKSSMRHHHTPAGAGAGVGAGAGGGVGAGASERAHRSHAHRQSTPRTAAVDGTTTSPASLATASLTVNVDLQQLAMAVGADYVTTLSCVSSYFASCWEEGDTTKDSSTASAGSTTAPTPPRHRPNSQRRRRSAESAKTDGDDHSQPPATTAGGNHTVVRVSVHSIAATLSANEEVFVSSSTGAVDASIDIVPDSPKCIAAGVRDLVIVPIVPGDGRPLSSRTMAGTRFQNERDWTQHAGGVAALRVQHVRLYAQMGADKHFEVDVGQTKLTVRAATFVYDRTQRKIVTLLPSRPDSFAVLRDLLVLRCGLHIKAHLFPPKRQAASHLSGMVKVAIDDQMELELCPLAIATLSQFAHQVGTRVEDAQASAKQALGLPSKADESTPAQEVYEEPSLNHGRRSMQVQKTITTVDVAVVNIRMYVGGGLCCVVVFVPRALTLVFVRAARFAVHNINIPRVDDEAFKRLRPSQVSHTDSKLTDPALFARHNESSANADDGGTDGAGTGAGAADGSVGSSAMPPSGDLSAAVQSVFSPQDLRARWRPGLDGRRGSRVVASNPRVGSAVERGRRRRRQRGYDEEKTPPRTARVSRADLHRTFSSAYDAWYVLHAATTVRVMCHLGLCVCGCVFVAVCVCACVCMVDQGPSPSWFFVFLVILWLVFGLVKRQ